MTDKIEKSPFKYFVPNNCYRGKVAIVNYGDFSGVIKEIKCPHKDLASIIIVSKKWLDNNYYFFSCRCGNNNCEHILSNK